MSETLTKNTVLGEYSRIFREELKRIAEDPSGNEVDFEQIKDAATRQIKEKYDTDEMLDSLLESTAKQKLNEQAKAHGLSAILTHANQGEMFPGALDDAVISLRGVIVGFRAASSAMIGRQEREWIKNLQGVSTTTARNLEVTGPVVALMQENGMTAGEALDILRERD